MCDEVSFAMHDEALKERVWFSDAMWSHDAINISEGGSLGQREVVKYNR